MVSDFGVSTFEPGSRVHFVGIGGVRMSALAEMMARRGCTISGSDREASEFTDRLERAGVTVTIGHAAENVGDVDAVVFTPAVDRENPEIAVARQRGIRIVEGKCLLGEMTRGKRLIAVSGTHGKTTTTAMITQICETAGLDPTAFVGGAVQGDESNLRVGSDDLWVVEADEYDRAFLELAPSVAVVTSLEADHLDLYESEDEIVATFDQFLSGMSQGGTAVVSGDYACARALAVPDGCSRTSFGLDTPAHLTASDIGSDGFSTTFTVKRDGQALGDMTIRLPGRHNVSNALGAIGATLSVDVGWGAIREGLAAFRGVRRRFEVMGEESGITVVNDYAHHPTEIDQTLRAARSIWTGRIVAVFQPHLFTRTRDFAKAFSKALSAADVCWLTDIYAARETPIPGITGRTIANGVEGSHYEADLVRLTDAVMGTVESGDMVIVMGAGSIGGVAGELVERLSGRDLQGGRGAEGQRGKNEQAKGGTGEQEQRPDSSRQTT